MDESFADYRLTVECRWTGKPGCCGVPVHASTPRRLYSMFPQSIDCQLNVDNADDFWCIDGDHGRWIDNLTDGSEKPAGEWDMMVVECRSDTITVWVNDELVNAGTGCTETSGQFALQVERARCEFRRVEIVALS